MIAFWGSRGGCGTTTVAWNIAYRLHQTCPTILVDLHFGQGDLSVHADIQPVFSLREIGETGDRFDDTLIDSITLKHESGLRLLLQPSDGQPVLFHPEMMQKLLENLRKRYAYIVLDLGSRFDTSTAAIPYLDHLFLLVTQEIPSLALATQKLRRLNETGYHPGSLHILVNAYTKRSSVTLRHIAKVLVAKNPIAIRDDKQKIQSAINRGIPLCKVSRRGRAAKDLARLVERILKPESLGASGEEYPFFEPKMLPENPAPVAVTS